MTAAWRMAAFTKGRVGARHSPSPPRCSVNWPTRVRSALVSARDCLARFSESPSARTKTPTDQLIEAEDYYFDELGRTVFTATFLLKRGHCCGNGCRHCPYPKIEPNESAA